MRSLILCAALAGCAALGPTQPGLATHALPPRPADGLPRTFAALAAAHPDQSGFVLIDVGREDFVTRVAAAQLAERSIDVQTYLWNADDTGRLILQQLLDAANRGVRVRLLIDDIGTGGRDADLRAIDAHPNVEVRVYNPFATRGHNRLWEKITRFARIDRRMHNKAFIVDGAVAVMGGRNLGDAYFGVDEHHNVRDLDVLTAGPTVAQLGRSFDDYWNSEFAHPIGSLTRAPGRRELAHHWRAFDAAVTRARRRYPYALADGAARSTLTAARDRMIWARGEMVWDAPAKTRVPGAKETLGRVALAYVQLIEGVRAQLLEMSAYYVPRFHRRLFLQLQQRHVRVRVLTNSLDSTDELPAQAGYARERPRLLAHGVELHELRADAASRALYLGNPGRSSSLGLHAKAVVYDDETLSIGSFNIDARSSYINTELMVIVHSRELAAQLTALIERDLRPENSWQVQLGPRHGLLWSSVSDGRRVETGFEPGRAWRAVAQLLLSVVPLGQL